MKLERYKSSDMRPTNRGVRDFIEKSRIAHGVLKILAVFGVSMIMADGVLTPAQSVLGAIQGLRVAKENISTSTIVGVSCAILILLFLVQPFGITKLGSTFAPVVIVWLLFNAVFGIYVSFTESQVSHLHEFLTLLRTSRTTTIQYLRHSLPTSQAAGLSAIRLKDG